MFLINFGAPNRQKFRPEGKKQRWLAFQNQERLPDGLQDPFSQNPSPIFRDFGVPPGTPKSPKIGLLPKNGGPKAFIFSIFAGKGAAVHFFIGFHRFLTQKSMFFSLFFSSHPCFFLDMATFTIVRFFRIETYFFIFCFFVCFCKK